MPENLMLPYSTTLRWFQKAEGKTADREASKGVVVKAT
jgi:hypothetical protein